MNKSIETIFEYKNDIIKLGVSALPLFIYSLSYTSFSFSCLLTLIQYVPAVQECVYKMFFTALFHIIHLDKNYKYCPDYYVLAMMELKKKYMNQSVYKHLPLHQGQNSRYEYEEMSTDEEDEDEKEAHLTT
jgi:hypothetical protein